MDRHRKANQFPDQNTPGDSRLLGAIERRTPNVAGGGVSHFFGGVVLDPEKARRAKTFKLPFQVSASPLALKAAPGTFCDEDFPENIESAPADGSWYFYGKAVLNDETGEITEKTVDWYNSEQTTTATDKFHLIGTAVLSGGLVSSYANENYGPISFFPHGDISNNWSLFFI